MFTFLLVSCSFFDYNSDFTGIHKQEKNASKGKAAHGLHDLSPHVDFLALYTVPSIHDFDAEASKVRFFSYLKVQDFTKRTFFVYFHISTHCVEE